MIVAAPACIASLKSKSKSDYLNRKSNKQPTLEGRLKHPLSSREEAIGQMIRNGDILTPLAEKILYRCQQAHDAEERNSKEQTVVVESELMGVNC